LDGSAALGAGPGTRANSGSYTQLPCFQRLFDRCAEPTRCPQAQSGQEKGCQEVGQANGQESRQAGGQEGRQADDQEDRETVGEAPGQESGQETRPKVGEAPGQEKRAKGRQEGRQEKRS